MSSRMDDHHWTIIIRYFMNYISKLYLERIVGLREAHVHQLSKCAYRFLAFLGFIYIHLGCLGLQGGPYCFFILWTAPTTKIIYAQKELWQINVQYIEAFHPKKLNWKLVQFSPQNSTNYFEVIWGKYWHKSLTLDNPHSNIAIQFHIFMHLRKLIYGLVFASKQLIFADFIVFLNLWMFIITFFNEMWLK